MGSLQLKAAGFFVPNDQFAIINLQVAASRLAWLKCRVITLSITQGRTHCKLQIANC
jgi:hypothetical protein